jgi:hypothetical protein
MTSAAVVLVCALELLGRSGASLPRIELIRAPSVVDENVEAFVVAGEQTIWIITTSEVFEVAARSACRDDQAVAKVASIIAHEEWHVLHGADERGAYEAQLATLVRLGVPPQSPVYLEVLRSMRVVLGRQMAGSRRSV